MLTPLIQGVTLGASLIIAIGSQNAFVLRQGLRKEYVFTICTICFLCDALLILLGVGGFGTLVASSDLLMLTARWGGALFLFIYGIRSFRSAFKNEALAVDNSATLASGLSWAIATTFALTLLNPHVSSTPSFSLAASPGSTLKQKGSPLPLAPPLRPWSGFTVSAMAPAF